MKNIFSPHVREVHILEKHSLRLRVTGIGQAIDVLSFISASLKIMGPMNPEASITLGEEGCGGIELVEISYIPKEKAHHKNVYIVNLTPKLRSATTLIFNEDVVAEVDKRLKHLINRFGQESKQALSKGFLFKPTLSTIYPKGEGLKFVLTNAAIVEHYLWLDKIGSSRQLEPGCEQESERCARNRDPNQKVEVYTITADKTNCDVTGQMIGRLKPLKEVNITKLIGEPMECRDGSYYSSEAYLRQHELLLSKKKES